MKYKVGDRIITKKPHACTNNEWVIERIGADVKIKCLKCGRAMFLLEDELKKITKKHIEVINAE